MEHHARLLRRRDFCHRDERFCHREGRNDLAFVMKITRNERLPRCARNDKKYNREGSFLSSRGTKRSRLSHEDNQKWEIAALRSPLSVIARYEAISVDRGWQTVKREIAALRSPLSVIARDEAISVDRGWQTDKRKIAALRSPLSVIARNVAISVVRGWLTEKREIASQARNDKDSCHREVRSDLALLALANRDKRDCFAGSQ